MVECVEEFFKVFQYLNYGGRWKNRKKMMQSHYQVSIPYKSKNISYECIGVSSNWHLSPTSDTARMLESLRESPNKKAVNNALCSHWYLIAITKMCGNVLLGFLAREQLNRFDVFAVDFGTLLSKLRVISRSWRGSKGRDLLLSLLKVLYKNEDEQESQYTLMRPLTNKSLDRPQDCGYETQKEES
ncbi:hypothetical protein J1N35_009463 [Gossypium stocksii]|uniref:Uncharacterized protein n=1 Tax=Gossypium stocksii TaxID=47602 RepID=A0A9D3W0N9_9ROSI|nr:hypothetical protein J1N35_009463 [Gossypium stocksii]